MRNLLLDLNGVIELPSGSNEPLLAFVDELGSERCAVLTSMTGMGIRFAAEDAGLDERFAALVSAQSYGLSKHESLLFTKVLDDLGWSAEETVFVDDLEHNVAAAQQAGLEAIRFDGDTDALIEELRALLA